MTGSKPVALPLGDIPTKIGVIDYKIVLNKSIAHLRNIGYYDI